MEGFKQCKRCTMEFMLSAPLRLGTGNRRGYYEHSRCPDCGVPFWHGTIRAEDGNCRKDVVRVGVLPENARMIPQKRTA
jgi:hypothetical protein